MAIKASYQITLADITDAYSANLSSDSYTFTGNTSGAPSGLSCSTSVTAYCGSVACSSVTVAVSCPTGISSTITNNGSASPTITFKTTATVTSSCEATITIAVDDITITKKFSFAVAKMGSTGPTGPTGEDGKGIKKTDITYQAGSSQTSAPTGSWSSSVPALTTSLPYLWTRTIITYTDNTTSTSYSVSSTLDSIEVGGRNLALYTNQGTSYWVWNMQVGDYTATEVDVNGVRACKLTRGSTEYSGWSVIYYAEISPTKYEPSTDYTVSFDVLPSVSTALRVRLTETDVTDGLSTQKISKTLSENTWNRVSVKITTLATLPESRKQVLYLDAMNSDPGVSYIFKNLKIEKGNKATDWTPAPEDIEQQLDDTVNDLYQEITNSSTSIISDCESIILEAVSNYTKTSDFDTFKQTVESQLELLADELTIKFTQSTEGISKVNDDLQQKFNTITKYFSFDVNGLTIGQEDNPNKVVIDNDEIAIVVNGTTVQKFDAAGNALIPDLKVTHSMNLFGYLINQDSNGNVNMSYVGGEEVEWL